MSNIKATQMLTKLNELYDKKESIQDTISTKMLELEQVQEDIDMLQTMIMYSANRSARIKEVEGARDKWERSLNGR